MICLRCGCQCKSFNYWCFNCTMNLDEHTGANYNQIIEIKSLLTKCENLEKLINGFSSTSSILTDDINEMKKISLFKLIYNQFNKILKQDQLEDNSEENQKTKDILELKYIKNQLIYILNKLENAEYIIEPTNKTEIENLYIKEIEQYDNKTKYNPNDINIAKIYEVQESFRSKDKISNLIVCQEFISPGCINSNNKIYTVEQITNTSIVDNAIDKKFYIPYKTFKYFTDKPLTTKEAAQLLYNLTEEEFFELIDKDYEEEQLDSISVNAKIKKLSDKYI